MNCSVEEALKSTPSAYAPELAKLSLVGKHIGTLIHSPLAIAKSVQTLYLSNNNLKTLEGLSDYSNLKCLSCTNNCIRYLGDLKWLRQTPLIEKLSFVGNPVTAMPFYREHLISMCPNVTVIDSRNVLLKEKLDSKITAKKAQLFYNQLRLNDLRICILIHLNKLTRCHLQIQQRMRSGYKSHLASHIQSPVPQTRSNTIDINQTRIWSDILGSQYIESVLRVTLSGGVFHSLQVECSDDFDRHIQETAYQLHATRVTNMTSADKVHLSSSYIYMSKHWESVLAEYLDSQHKLSFQLLNDTANLSISSVGSSSTSATNKVNSKLNMRKATQSNDDTIRSSHDESNLNSPPSRISTLMLPDNGPQEGSIASKSKQNESVSTAGPSSIKDSIIYLDQIFFIQPTNADTSIATDTNTKFSAYPTSNQSSPILPTSNAPKKQTTPTSTATSRPTLAPPKSSASPPRGLKTQNTKEPPITSKPYVVDLGPQLFPTKPYALTKTQKQAQALEATLNSMNSTQTRSVRSSSDKNLVTEQYNALVHRMKNSNTEPSINIHPNRISICDSLNSATIPSIDSSVNLSLQSLSLPPQQEEPDDDSTESSVTLVDESEIRFFIDKVIDSQYTNERQIAFRQISQVDVQSLFQLPKFDFEYIFEGTEELEVLLSGNANDESINNGTSANSHPFEFVNVAGIKSMKEMKSLVDLCTVELIRQQRAEAHFIARAEACSAAVQAHKDVVIRNVKSAEIYTNQFESYLQVYRDDITKAKQWVTVYKSSLDKIQVTCKYYVIISTQ